MLLCNLFSTNDWYIFIWVARERLSQSLFLEQNGDLYVLINPSYSIFVVNTRDVHSRSARKVPFIFTEVSWCHYFSTHDNCCTLQLDAIFFFFLIFGWALIKSLNEVAQLFTEVFKVQMKKKNLENNDEQHVGNNWIERHSFASLIV